MRFLGYDEKLVRLMESLYEGTMSVVRVDGGLTEWFVAVIGVMQGCILPPLLFNILLEIVMALALDNWESGVKVFGTSLSNLRFADDISLLANSEGELQQLVNTVHFTSGRFGPGCQWLQDRSVMHWTRSTGDEYQAGYQQSEADRTLWYLGGAVSADQSCYKDIERRIGLASGIVRKLRTVKDKHRNQRDAI